MSSPQHPRCDYPSTNFHISLPVTAFPNRAPPSRSVPLEYSESVPLNSVIPIVEAGIAMGFGMNEAGYGQESREWSIGSSSTSRMELIESNDENQMRAHPSRQGEVVREGMERKDEFDQTDYDPYTIKSRRKTTPTQRIALENHFESDPKPDVAIRKIIGAQINMSCREVQVWFQNRRAKDKKLQERRERLALAAALASQIDSSRPDSTTASPDVTAKGINVDSTNPTGLELLHGSSLEPLRRRSMVEFVMEDGKGMHTKIKKPSEYSHAPLFPPSPAESNSGFEESLIYSPPQYNEIIWRESHHGALHPQEWISEISLPESSRGRTINSFPPIAGDRINYVPIYQGQQQIDLIGRSIYENQNHFGHYSPVSIDSREGEMNEREGQSIQTYQDITSHPSSNLRGAIEEEISKPNYHNYHNSSNQNFRNSHQQHLVSESSLQLTSVLDKTYKKYGIGDSDGVERRASCPETQNYPSSQYDEIQVHSNLKRHSISHFNNLNCNSTFPTLSSPSIPYSPTSTSPTIYDSNSDYPRFTEFPPTPALLNYPPTLSIVAPSSIRHFNDFSRSRGGNVTRSKKEEGNLIGKEKRTSSNNRSKGSVSKGNPGHQLDWRLCEV